jgi:Pentapeptide repeats (8 copies)
MRPLSNGLSVVLVVGCFVAAVVVAGEQEGIVEPCEGPYKGRTPTPEELQTILRNHQAWLESGRKPDDERQANLCQADLSGANLQEALLFWANLQGARLLWANLQGAFLSEATLQKADLRQANLQGAHLYLANLQGAVLYGANLQGAVYETDPGKLPNFWTLTDPDKNHLETLVFFQSPAALIALRKAFKEGGMRTQERQLTYAIERTKRLQAWNPSWWETHRQEDTRPWREKLTGKSESLFSYVLFELPSHYGMAPGRALWSLLGLILIFALPYWMAIKHANSRSGIWMILPEDRLASRSGKKKAVLLRPPMAKTWRERLVSESRMFRTGLYFSLLSAFHLGWRELNVGTWIARLQFREYTLRATGWVRMVAGIQSLLSVYLLALWVLTYFGRPFE